MRKRKVAKIGIAGVLVLIAIVVLWYRAQQQGEDAGMLRLSGSVEVRDVYLSFEVPGRLAAIFVEEGDSVSRGEVLAVLDSLPFVHRVQQAQALLAARLAEWEKVQRGARPQEIEQARAQLALAEVALREAKRHYVRAQHLRAEDATTEEAFERAEAAYEQARAQPRAAEARLDLLTAGARPEDRRKTQAAVEQAKVQLAEARRQLQESRLVSPITGIVHTRIREPGEFVPAGSPVFAIARTDGIWVRAYVSERSLPDVRPGMQVTVQTDDGRQFPGRVGYISPTAEFTPKNVETEEVRTSLVYRIRVIVDDATASLRQGMPVTVVIPIAASTERQDAEP